MRGFWLLVLLLVLPMCASLLYGVEGFSPSTKQDIVLIGDSVLNNSRYVPAPLTVAAQLQEHVNANANASANAKVINLAEDGARIEDVARQLQRFPPSNGNDTAVIISVGGNNLLQNDTLETMQQYYEEMLRQVRQKLPPKAHIVLLTVYQPTSPTYQHLTSDINSWNNWLLRTFDKQDNCVVVDLRQIVTEPTDFENDIEPSVQGGKKIANTLRSFI